MASNLNYKQVANVARRTWDVETYEQRAKDRANNNNNTNNGKSSSKKKKSEATSEAVAGEKRPLIDVEDDSHREEFIPAAKGAAGPHLSKRAFLKARRNKVDVDSKIGSVEIVNPEAAATTKSISSEAGSAKDGITKTGIGWHCKVCDCFLKDSLTYLDHINGKKHQRNLGYSMRVERSTKDQVSSRLAMLAKEKESTKLEDSVEEENFYDVVKFKDEEAKRRKEERAKKRKERKMKKKEEQPEKVENAENEDAVVVEEEEEGGIDPGLAAMMGFSGFGGGNKNR